MLETWLLAWHLVKNKNKKKSGIIFNILRHKTYTWFVSSESIYFWQRTIPYVGGLDEHHNSSRIGVDERPLAGCTHQEAALGGWRRSNFTNKDFLGNYVYVGFPSLMPLLLKRNSTFFLKVKSEHFRIKIFGITSCC